MALPKHWPKYEKKTLLWTVTMSNGQTRKWAERADRAGSEWAGMRKRSGELVERIFPGVHGIFPVVKGIFPGIKGIFPGPYPSKHGVENLAWNGPFGIPYCQPRGAPRGWQTRPLGGRVQL